MAIWCLFEQTGTLKNVLIKKGYKNVYDVDIVNTDHVDYCVDLFESIDTLDSFSFDNFIENNIEIGDVVFAFFPCVRFSWASNLLYKCNNSSLKKLSDYDKCKYNLNYFNEFYVNYCRLLKLIKYCIFNDIKLIIENPYNNNNNYLLKFLPFEPSVIIKDRRVFGDNFEKCTMFYFINCNSSFDLNSFDYYHDINSIPTKKVYDCKNNSIERSLINPLFFENFINIYCKEVLADENI